MVHALLKIVFTKQPSNMSDIKDTLTFCDKLKKRFHVITRSKFINDQLSYIIIAALGENEAKIEYLFEKIIDFCDSSEFGRVYESNAYVEDIESLAELNTLTEIEYEP